MNNYTIVELQTANGVTSIITVVKDNINAAEQEYHTKLAYAAVSDVEIHAVSMLNATGGVVKHEYFMHEHNNIEETK